MCYNHHIIRSARQKCLFFIVLFGIYKCCRSSVSQVLHIDKCDIVYWDGVLWYKMYTLVNSSKGKVFFFFFFFYYFNKIIIFTIYGHTPIGLSCTEAF